jgi:hypothetical protein
MEPSALYFVYLTIMSAAFLCFLQAYRTRLHTPTHKRWGVTGVLISLTGIAAVLIASRLWGWTVPQRHPDVVLWHRRLAYVAAAMIVLVALSGALRWPLHTRLFVVFLPLYGLVLLLAIVGYGP